MDLNGYQREAAKTKQPAADLLYLAIKTVIEAAEMAQPVVKYRYHDKALDLDAMADELGDLLWYVAVSADEIGYSLDKIALRNLAKLRARHGDTYNASHYGERAHASAPGVPVYDYTGDDEGTP